MSEARYGPIADRIAQQAGIPPDLFRRLIGAESSWNPRAGSNMGAQGLTQLMPATARGLGVSNVHDPVQNMRGGARYLRQQYDKFGRWDYALAAYNAGPGAVQQYGGIPPYRETQQYVPRVLGGRDYPAPGAAPGPSGRSAPPPAREFAETAQALPGQPLDGDRLWMLLENQRKRSLRGLMPAKGFQPQLGKLASMALERAQATVQPGGSYPEPPPAAPGGQRQNAAPPRGFPKWTNGGGPEAHHSRPLGDWQSDDAYDLMGKANDPVYAGVNGEVIKISGQPGGDPGKAGYGITVRTSQGDFFFKHLNTNRVRVGQRITPSTLLGTLDPTTAGGPHLHLGGTNRAALDRLFQWYLRAGGGR